tara:strand:- start:730 stop:1050 length:321 start_codon:yes stop_codon:yes gene_type:complete
MRSKEEIEWALAKEYQYLDDHNHPMDEMQWAHNQGWIKALEFVLDHKKEKVKDITHITKGANNDTIRRALKRLSEECGFGRKNNAVNSQNDSIRDGFLYGPQRCTT